MKKETGMRLGIWTPAPQTIRPDPVTKPALDGLTQYGGGPDANFEYAVKLLNRAEEIGFDITLIAQRWFGPDLDSWMFAAALAPVVRKMELMAAVHPGIADPRIMAKLAASLDRISGGRFCINIVNGTRPHEHNMYGRWIESDGGRYRQMQEFIQAMKGLMTQDSFTLDGEFYTMENAIMPTRSVRAPYPPFFAASRADEGMNVVAQECDTWFVNYDKDRANYEQSLKRIDHEMGLMEDRVRALGRKMNYGINAIVIIGETEAEAQAKADEHVRIAAQCPVGTSGVGANLIGTPKTIVERMKLYQSMGIDLFMLHFWPMHDGLEEFAEKILPDLRR
jgi:FMNH2-dependent dimethyl sulfone monooxygenase